MAEYLYTSDQGLPYPSAEDGMLRNVNDYIRNLALAIEPYLVRRYANQAAFDSANPSPEEGMNYYLLDVHEQWVIGEGGPERIYPPKPFITFGTGAPTGTGEAGQVYYDLEG